MADGDKIYWGILGAGDVAEVKSGPAFHLAQNSELSAVMRRDKEKAKDFAKRHGVSQWYDDADQLLNDTNINAIYIATPPKFHKDYAIKAIKAGKYVYLEKPMALNMKESQAIAIVQRELNGKLCIAHYRRALDAFIFIKKLLSDKAIGQVRFARISIFQPNASTIVVQTESNWRTNPVISGGGLFHDLAPHQIDLMINWFGNPVDITGLSANRSGYSDADDLVMGEFTCQNKVVIQGAWCFSVAASQALDSCEIYGSKGKISFSFFGDKVIWQNKEGIFEQTFNSPKNIQLPMIQQVVDYFQNKAENPCSPDDAIEVMRVMDRFTGLG
jgi:predicted dehydrogenase